MLTHTHIYTHTYMDNCSQRKADVTTERIRKIEAGIERQRDGLADVVSVQLYASQLRIFISPLACSFVNISVVLTSHSSASSTC
jgi:hypothetical protein